MEYVSRIDELLEATLRREVLANENKECRSCNKGRSAVWRCKDCCLSMPMCRGCIRFYHKENPFHRVEQWNGHFFRPAELSEAGTYLLVRHHLGIPLCDTLLAQENFLEQLENVKDNAEQESLNPIIPSAPTSSAPTIAEDDFDDDIHMRPADDVEDGSDDAFMQYLQDLRDHSDEPTKENEYNAEVQDDVEEEDLGTETHSAYSQRPSAIPIMGTYVRIVHTNGVHNLAMISCECQGHDVLASDLLAARLLPASFQKIRTLFTAHLLDFFRLCNLELKATAYQFYHLLRRLTSPMAPAEVVDLYREFRRMSRIWRWMKRLKWAGYGNRKSKVSEVKAGQLSVFCPACPQPGINIPDNWREDTARHVLKFTMLDG